MFNTLLRLDFVTAVEVKPYVGILGVESPFHRVVVLNIDSGLAVLNVDVAVAGICGADEYCDGNGMVSLPNVQFLPQHKSPPPHSWIRISTITVLYYNFILSLKKWKHKKNVIKLKENL